ncbi:MAG: superoxide dismutase [Candidatus Micrarchaeia archaeon]
MKKYELPKLDYDYGALEPVISAKIMELHHAKHHAGYVKGANDALETLEKLRSNQTNGSVGDVLRKLSFNLNGHLMHSLFWKNMRPPKENNMPKGKIADALKRDFGSFEAFAKQFSETAVSVEGSGWAALVKDEEKNLFLVQIEKHNLMHLSGFKPLLVLDVWEHAYYLDYQNKRADFVQNWWKLVNWEYVNSQF